ncbi:MAG TPA: tetratricopeptide repeat protein [Gammaproteobacteria bacterium]|nr:tetratricopeptide repeat protein [Gammaproteobacteria bacterium]
MKMNKLVPTLLAVSVIAGCVSVPPSERRGDVRVIPPPQPPPVISSPVLPPVERPPVVAEPATPVQPAPSQPTPLPPAARSLAAQAERASQAGDHEAAAAHLERALRVAPNHPVLWQNLAVVRYRQRDYGKVEGLALKSNSLAAAQPGLRAENWRLIAEVRRQRGDSRGADAAMVEARRLGSTAQIR